MKAGDKVEIVSVRNTVYSEALVGEVAEVVSMKDEAVALRLAWKDEISLPKGCVEPYVPDRRGLLELLDWVDGWCGTCTMMGEDECSMCIVRAMSSWADGRLKGGM